MISLGLLFTFVLIITVDIPICFEVGCEFIGWKELASRNVVSLVSLIGILYCMFAYIKFDYDLNSSHNIPFQVTKVESINYEHLTFLATYVVPLISFDFDSGRQMIVLALLLVVMGAIYIKTDLFYANPSLALLGFHIYKADGIFKNDKTRDGMVLISRNRIIQGQKATYLKLDDNIYYVKGCKL